MVVPVNQQNVLRKIYSDEKHIELIAKTAYQGNDFDFPLLNRMPLTRLTVVTYLLGRKYDEYKTKGITDYIIFDTFKDVSLRAALYYKKTGKSGLTKDDVHMVSAYYECIHIQDRKLAISTI